MSKMADHISDGPKDPEDYPETIPERSFDDIKDDLEQRDRKLLFDLSYQINHISRYNAFDHIAMIDLLKRCKRRIEGGFYGR